MEADGKPLRAAGFVCVLGVTAFGVGCAVRAPPDGPPHMPENFTEHPLGAAKWPAQDWYRGFSSHQLDEFIDRARTANLDVAQARARVAQADARLRMAGAALLPSVDANVNPTYLAGHSAAGTAHETDWSALLSASYELDFWGKNRAALRSSQLDAAGFRADSDAIALTTLASVADAYFELLALRERVGIAEQDRRTAEELLAVVQARFDAGLATPVEVATQKGARDAAALAVTELSAQAQQSSAALALLLGETPEGFAVDSEPLESLTEPAVAPGLPAELLTRRPDLARAEDSLRAADADVAVARAAMLPAVTLTAAGGVQNPALNAAVLALPGTGPTLSLGGALVQSIFDHGRLKAQQAEAEARRTELLAAYRAAILAALLDTERALTAIHQLDDARRFQDEALSESERAFEGAQLRFRQGAGDYLLLLEAQRTLYQVRDQVIRYHLARLQARVALCKALGGGWVRPT